MPVPLKVLMAEDSPADAELILWELRRAGFELDWHRVDTEAAYCERLDPALDIVLSDYEMPQFNGLRALELLKQRGLSVPFILVSGTIGEETAVQAMRNGATDYLLKDRLDRLGPAVSHALATTRLRTESRRGEEALRASEQRFKALFEQAAVGVAQAEAATGRFVQVNHHFCEIVGRNREEMVHLTFPDITHPEDRERDREVARQLRSGAIREATREKRYLRKDGSEVWVNLTLSAMWAPGKTPDYVIAVVQDVTKRKQLEEQFRQAQKMEAIGTLAGGIAHDFNNILTAIVGYTELAQMDLKDNPGVSAHLGSVLTAASRATDLIRQILTFSRQQPPERRLINLLPVVAESLDLLRSTIPTTIEFDTSLGTDSPIVLADATQIHQLLMNLGTNAWHAMKEAPGRLEVNLERWVVGTVQAALEPRLRPGVYAHLSVGDTGCGMDEATQRRIFEPFFTTKCAGEGTGLGLAVVHGIMDSHDGVVTVESEPGKGTTFHLYFPAHAGAADLALPSAEGPMLRGQGQQILVVDDEELIANMIREALCMLGYLAEVATEPAKALATVRSEPGRFALVITDQTMPGMTGLVLAQQITLIRSDLPVIMMTGYSAALMSDRVEAAGVRRLLLKPITIHLLAAAVHAVLAAVPQAIPPP